ncbi:trypsin-like peptidase domain-containing protein [Mameliella sediminis]|uniref:trypsin-like peptidase domain-containing protein n=1 Tax=Mameliella sediminis TaxID=2836866 RepID=UPI001C448922|nr:trypsin-like peptidase domain-containing protein [Mameliella sediminis]MBV7393358.1 trypsin-like peptidase domain-containing protein [Mameliella sediminis]
MRRVALKSLLLAVLAAPLAAQPVEFDPSDFGKIVVAPRQSSGTGFVLEQAFGDYQNEPVISYGEKSIARRLGRPVGRLDVLYKNGKTGYCTAFIVDTEHLVTNNHCIPGIDGVGVQAAQFVVGYVDAAHPDKAEKFQVGLEPLETSAALDYSVLRVFGDPSARYGKVLLANADPDPSEFLWIIGHPQGQAQHISREGCAAGDPPVSTEGKVVHTCDTLGGNSGSPVFRISDRQVVALHHAGDNRTGFNFAIPMTRILQESQILKAAAPVSPPEPPKGQGACEILWGAAEQHGCLGYQTFLEQCGAHPLAPLARGLADRSCKAAGGGTPPDTGPAVNPLKDSIDTALRTAEGRRAEIAREITAANRAVLSLEGTVNRARARAGDAESSVDPGSAEVTALWTGITQRLSAPLTDAQERVRAMSGLLASMDAELDVLRAATTEAEIDSALKRAGTLAESSRERLAFVSARKTMAEALFKEGEAEALALLQDAVNRQTEDPRAAALRRSIDAALVKGNATRKSMDEVQALALKQVAAYEEIVARVYVLAQEARETGGPGDTQVAELWEALARGLAGDLLRVQSRAEGMERLAKVVDTGLDAIAKAKDEAVVTQSLLRVDNTGDLSAQWLNQIIAQVALAERRISETEKEALALRKAADQQAARAPIVTQCLEVSMPQFAVEGIAGVSRVDFDADAAELACSAARKISDEPAVHYGYARALITKKRYSEAIPILRNPRMGNFLPARYSLGVAYNSGLGLRKNYDLALEIYRETAGAGLPQGKFSLGVYYSLGRAVRTDHALAAKYLVESIADGYAHPITQLHKLPNATTREIQRDLVARGYLRPGDVDGVFGPTTRGALERLVAAAPRPDQR